MRDCFEAPRWQIIGALAGLVNACGNNPKTENTDVILLSALRLFHELSDMSSPDSAARAEKCVREIHDEKNRVAPDCARCTHPCGNTADYDLRRLAGESTAMREKKRLLAETLGRQVAVCPETGEELLQLTEHCCRGICLFTMELDPDTFEKQWESLR